MENRDTVQQQRAGIKETIRRWLGFVSLGILCLGLGLCTINAFAAVIGWLGKSNKRFISLHITSLGGFIAFALFAVLFVFVYWFKAAEGFRLIKDKLPFWVPIFLLVVMVSRLLSSGGDRAYGPFDGVASIGLVLFLGWPLWAVHQTREPRPRPVPTEEGHDDEAYPGDPTQFGGPVADPTAAQPGMMPPIPGGLPQFPMRPPGSEGEAGYPPPQPPQAGM